MHVDNEKHGKNERSEFKYKPYAAVAILSAAALTGYVINGVVSINLLTLKINWAICRKEEKSSVFERCRNTAANYF